MRRDPQQIFISSHVASRVGRGKTRRIRDPACLSSVRALENSLVQRVVLATTDAREGGSPNVERHTVMSLNLGSVIFNGLVPDVE